MKTTISYTGFNELVEAKIREYVKGCEGIGEELDSGFFIPTGIRTITFEGEFTCIADEVELEDLGVAYDLTITTVE